MVKFRANSRRAAAEYEKEIAKIWAKNRTFERSIELRDPANAYVFYDGPPFITGVPHHGTLLSSIVKDAIPRYWTMKGRRVERKWGWDCHGLPAENFVEKALGITDRRQILTDDVHRFEPENSPFAQKNGNLKIARADEKSWTESAKKLAPRGENGEILPTISLEKYIETARKSMKDNSETWKPVISRVGRWVDMSAPYRTMNADYMESVWWAFAKLFKAGKIYEGEKVLMYDTHFATPVAKAEVTMDNDAYQTVSDPSVYVGFELVAPPENLAKFARENEKIFMLAWTTTPWTLPGNTALAVNPLLNYVLLRDEKGARKFVVAKDLAENVAKTLDIKLEILAEFSGESLVGAKYEPLFSGRLDYEKLFARAENAKSNQKTDRTNFAKIWPADYVSAESGTGVVHIAPIYGEDDFALGAKNRIPRLHILDDNGYFFGEVSVVLRAIFEDAFFAGEENPSEKLRELLAKVGVKIGGENSECLEAFSANKLLAKALEKIGKVQKIVTIRHEYPFNPRSKSRIMYRAIPAWFFDVQGEKKMLLAQNENVNWFPAHLKHGRFQKNIEQAPDWNLSRNRFWASAMPVWKGDKGGLVVVGSYAELEQLSGVKLDDYHRPWVDGVRIFAKNLSPEIRAKYGMRDDEIFTRTPEVLDCWFESGSMPFAQLHYPFENRAKFEQNYPADFIVEYIGQVRAWFYYVHLVNSSLAEIGAFDETENGEKSARIRTKLNAYSNVITTGVVAGNDGRKMSKSLGNFTDPNALMDQFSADSLRFLLLSSPLLNGEDFALKDKDVSDVSRKLAMIWNVYDFFTLYAESEGFEVENPQYFRENSTNRFANSGAKIGERAIEIGENFIKNPLDKWIISRVHELEIAIATHVEKYDVPEATAPILPFVDDLSNWFVRRSRRRFAKNPDAEDQAEAFLTLHYVLSFLSVILAPLAPFLSEELYQKLVGGESVHLENWPEKSREIDEKILSEMARARKLIEAGLALRMQKTGGTNSVKIRQPLAVAHYAGAKFGAEIEQIIAEELNVKKVEHVENLAEFLRENHVNLGENEDGNTNENYAKFAEKNGETWLEISKKITPELRREGLAREVIRAVQSARKHAKLRVDDRIELAIECENIDGEIARAIEEFRGTIAMETLAKTVEFGAKVAGGTFAENASIEGEKIAISLAKI